MNDFPHIAILIITFERYELLKRVMYALQKFVNYPKDKLHIVVSDDSTGGTKVNSLSRIKAFKVWGAEGLTILETSERSGWGKHVNFALSQIGAGFPDVKFVFQIEDDYILQSPLDLEQGVAIMENRPNIGMLRYRGTAGARYIYHQFEAPVTNLLDGHDKISYLQIDNASADLYVYSNGPHLKRVQAEGEYPAFHEFYGKYDEGKKLGETEEKFAHRVKDGMKLGGAPAIAILPDWVNMRFAHEGDSFQHGKHDIQS